MMFNLKKFNGIKYFHALVKFNCVKSFNYLIEFEAVMIYILTYL